VIITIKGTSGSGKSTIVRRIMEQYPGARMKWKREGRRQPVCYQLGITEPGARGLVVPGHYETACGGCDTLPSYDFTMDLIRRADSAGFDVLYEGLLLSGDVKRTAALHAEGRNIIVFAIQLPLEECLASVNARRREKNPEAPDVDPRTTTAKWRGVHLAMDRLKELGVRTYWGTRTQVLFSIARLLGREMNEALVLAADRAAENFYVPKSTRGPDLETLVKETVEAIPGDVAAGRASEFVVGDVLRKEDTEAGRDIWAAVDKAAARAPDWIRQAAAELDVNEFDRELMNRPGAT
jgi:hypothetical protein